MTLLLTHPFGPFRNKTVTGSGQWITVLSRRRQQSLHVTVPFVMNPTFAMEWTAWPGTLGAKGMSFVIPLQSKDCKQFAFTRKCVRYTFTHLPQDFIHSPKIAHVRLGKGLFPVTLLLEICMYQYIDDVYWWSRLQFCANCHGCHDHAFAVIWYCHT